MIRFAELKDVPDIMKFIDSYWKKDHILAREKDVFIYEYTNNGVVNMVISTNDEGCIDGIEGFIPYGKNDRDIMLALWKVVKSDNPMLGIELLQFIQQNTDSKRISCTGINNKVIPIYKYMGYLTGKMTQWYRLNEGHTRKIAKVTDETIPKPSVGTQYDLVPFESFEALRKSFSFDKYYESDPKPLKEDWYVEKRYFKHPIYQYKVYGIRDENGTVETLTVFRVQECNGSRALRFVDVIGNLENVYHITEAIDGLMKQLDAEYTDFYEKGLSAEKMIETGWLKVTDSGNVIPNYFYPYLQENVDINYFVQDDETVLFKADGDQDRPN